LFWAALGAAGWLALGHGELRWLTYAAGLSLAFVAFCV